MRTMVIQDLSKSFVRAVEQRCVIYGFEVVAKQADHNEDIEKTRAPSLHLFSLCLNLVEAARLVAVVFLRPERTTLQPFPHLRVVLLGPKAAGPLALIGVEGNEGVEEAEHWTSGVAVLKHDNADFLKRAEVCILQPRA